MFSVALVYVLLLFIGNIHEELLTQFDGWGGVPDHRLGLYSLSGKTSYRKIS